LALETKPGELVKIVSSTSLENVTFALKSRDVFAMTGHLVSMVGAYKGIENMPLALIARHIHNELIQMHAQEPIQEAGGLFLSKLNVFLTLIVVQSYYLLKRSHGLLLLYLCISCCFFSS
jgi:hypothetical protein